MSSRPAELSLGVGCVVFVAGITEYVVGRLRCGKSCESGEAVVTLLLVSRNVPESDGRRFIVAHVCRLKLGPTSLSTSIVGATFQPSSIAVSWEHTDSAKTTVVFETHAVYESLKQLDPLL